MGVGEELNAVLGSAGAILVVGRGVEDGLDHSLGSFQVLGGDLHRCEDYIRGFRWVWELGLGEGGLANIWESGGLACLDNLRRNRGRERFFAWFQIWVIGRMARIGGREGGEEEKGREKGEGEDRGHGEENEGAFAGRDVVVCQAFYGFSIHVSDWDLNGF